ncbi:MAG: hypothetical protein H0X73_12460 [Chthoniobacterales bacterium]|nr:hypothetical protein [Chthoniobacterales bacterium]
MKFYNQTAWTSTTGKLSGGGRHVAALVFLLLAAVAPAATFNVRVGGDAPAFDPSLLTIQPGDTVTWTWASTFYHSVTSGKPGIADGLFDAGIHRSPFTFSYTFPNAGTFDYYCIPHLNMGMTGRIIVGSGTSTSASQPLNISTRMRVETGDNVLIGGFIVTGTQPKKVIVRAVGPSLQVNGVPVPGRLANPTLELYGPSGLITSNDNWQDAPNKQETIDSTIPPTDPLESAIVATLPANGTGIGYTAIVRGAGGGTGVGSMEVYDLDPAANSKLANISSRGFVQTQDNVMIGGFILGKNTGSAKVIVRAIGPSLPVAGKLADPTIELFNSNGQLVRGNDNWKDTQEAEIQATGIPPTNDMESAIVATLPQGSYTAIVAGKGGTTGVGLVEVYQLP